MSHGLPFPLPGRQGSIAYFAEGTADRLIVFVHGFGGKALKTWPAMTGLLADPRAGRSDVVFYGYASLAAPAQNSATLLHRFLDDAASLARGWRRAINEAGARPAARRYEDILIVAHSLGAAIARRALLDAISLDELWVERCRMVLFGPAHMGTRLTALQRELRSGIGTLLSDLMQFGRIRTPVLDDLAEGSPFLDRLLAETRTAIDEGWQLPLTARSVVFGEREWVVRTDRFADDPLSAVWEDQTHNSVCRCSRAATEVARHM